MQGALFQANWESANVAEPAPMSSLLDYGFGGLQDHLGIGFGVFWWRHPCQQIELLSPEGRSRRKGTRHPAALLRRLYASRQRDVDRQITRFVASRSGGT